MATAQTSNNTIVDKITVVNVKKQELNKRGIRDFKAWNNGQNLYIGRDMTRYIEGAKGSKWGNPFQVNKYGLKRCLELYEEHIKKTPELYNSLEELLNYKELGCWCKPEGCHGDILIKLLKEKVAAKT